MKRIVMSCAVLALAGLCALVPSPAGASAEQRTILETAASAGTFKTLGTALQSAGLGDALNGDGPFTVFAPTDEAFEALGAGRVKTLLRPENRERLADILKFHVTPGRVSAAGLIAKGQAPTLDGQRLRASITNGQIRVEHALVQTADIQCSNGVIHVIDAVLIPAKDTIVETAQSAGSFGTLVAAAKAAGLASVLSGPGPFTIFAPTDEAFERLPRGTVDNLLKPENREKLGAILKYHVLPARVYAADALSAGIATTVEGSSLRVGYRAGRLTVNSSAILKTDLDASNGVIHVIDRVLLPGTPAPEMPALSVPGSPAELIRAAIARGVPLFNDGNPGACASVYEIAIGGLVALPNDAIAPEVRSALRASVGAAGDEADLTERAWLLRRALDSALARLDPPTPGA